MLPNDISQAKYDMTARVSVITVYLRDKATRRGIIETQCAPRLPATSSFANEAILLFPFGYFCLNLYHPLLIFSFIVYQGRVNNGRLLLFSMIDQYNIATKGP